MLDDLRIPQPSASGLIAAPPSNRLADASGLSSIVRRVGWGYTIALALAANAILAIAINVVVRLLPG